MSRRLELPFLSAPPKRGVFLAVDEYGLCLRDAQASPDRALRASFDDEKITRRLAGGRRSALARALGLHRRPEQSVFDATCGLGRDAAVLLGLGCKVRAAERHPIVHALLEDAVSRAQNDCPQRVRGWQGLMHVDAAEWLQAQAAPVADIIYLDPMFGSGRRALPKRAMQDLVAIVGDDPDAKALLEAARNKAGRRAVVKRHARAPALAPPDMQLPTRGARFDIYLS